MCSEVCCCCGLSICVSPKSLLWFNLLGWSIKGYEIGLEKWGGYEVGTQEWLVYLPRFPESFTLWLVQIGQKQLSFTIQRQSTPILHVSETEMLTHIYTQFCRVLCVTYLLALHWPLPLTQFPPSLFSCAHFCPPQRWFLFSLTIDQCDFL